MQFCVRDPADWFVVASLAHQVYCFTPLEVTQSYRKWKSQQVLLLLHLSKTDQKHLRGANNRSSPGLSSSSYLMLMTSCGLKWSHHFIVDLELSVCVSPVTGVWWITERKRAWERESETAGPKLSMRMMLGLVMSQRLTALSRRSTLTPTPANHLD